MPAPGDQHLPPPTTMSSNSTNFSNPFEPPPAPHITTYTAQQIATLQSRLDKQLGPEYISSRPGAGGQKVQYLAAEKSINLANEVFGFNGWSSQIRDIQVDFADEFPNGKVSVGLSVIVRVTLKDGAFHEDIGYGQIENCKSKAMAFEKAKKEGTTDALKRALRNFGNVLGNCIYDKEYLTKINKVKAVPSKKWNVDQLHRHADYAPPKQAPQPQPQPAKKTEDEIPLPNAPQDTEMLDLMGGSFGVDFEDEVFGSDAFDEADFGESHDPAAFQNSKPAPAAQAPSRPLPYETPSKPERTPGPPMVNQQSNRVQPMQNRSNGNGAAAPQQNPRQNVSNHQAPPAQARPLPPQTTSRPVTRASASGPITRQQISGTTSPVVLPGQAVKPTVQKDSNSTSTSGRSTPNRPQNQAPAHESDINMPPYPPSGPIPATVGFHSARAAEKVLQNPLAAAPAFNPNADSPSIRKTAGFDHKRSGPVPRGAIASLAGGNAEDSNAADRSNRSFSPATAAPQNTLPGHGSPFNPHTSANNSAYNRNFINPSQESTRRIGAPANNTTNSSLQALPGSRAPSMSTSGYKVPMKRPNDVGAAPNNNAANANTRPSQPFPSKPILGDITNVTAQQQPMPLPGHAAKIAATSSANGNGNGHVVDSAKRQRVDDAGTTAAAANSAAHA